jgi:transposase
MPRQRSKPDFPILVHKYHCKPVQEQMPEAVWAKAKAMQSLWNDLCSALDSLKSQAIEGQKLDWQLFQQQASDLVKSSSLNWEQGPAVLDRFLATTRRLGKGGGGWPKIQRRLTNFAIPHRFTSGGIPTERLFSARAKRIRLERPAPDAYDSNLRAQRRARSVRAVFGLDDVPVELLVKLHRPIPSNAAVKQVNLCGFFNAKRRWEYCLTITFETPPLPVQLREPKTICAIDLGWRKQVDDEGADYLRFGMLFDVQAKKFQEFQLPLRIPNYISKRFKSPDSWPDLAKYTQTIDLALETAKAKIKPLLSNSSEPEVAAFRGSLARMRQGGLFRLRRLLKEKNIQEEVVHLLDHFFDEIDRTAKARAGLRAHLMNRRRKIYEQLAVDLCRRYSHIAWEGDLNIKSMAEQETKEIALLRGAEYRTWVALHEFKRILRNAAIKNNTVIIDVKASYTTTQCWVCGRQAEKSASLILTCPEGHAWDQDRNAARNLADFIPQDLLRQTGEFPPAASSSSLQV